MAGAVNENALWDLRMIWVLPPAILLVYGAGEPGPMAEAYFSFIFATCNSKKS